ncbi:DUF6270 domain-containing protein [Salinicola sp. MH3R3-1]|uniref:DUF6270 domain-containing protein n=1 Tax=Salinicola sp. MH3R3-1 TaxID=1928762 RepID=UPI000B003E87|nr:DUF6270 domain-containing protein [Salinicola sp. MH3R3-1]
MKVFIFGSCVSRDAFNFDFPRLELVGYFSRSSFASAFGSSPQKDNYSQELNSNFQKRMVKADFEKEALQKIVSTEFDILLIDFVDERFKLFKSTTGSIVTLSNELSKTPFLRQAEGVAVSPFSDEHFQLWERGWKKFVSSLSSHNLLSKVVVNCGLWAKTDEQGNAIPNVDLNLIEKANSHLRRLYDRVFLDIPASQAFMPSDKMVVGKLEHKWGAAPFHYVDNYYYNLVDFLVAFDDSR